MNHLLEPNYNFVHHKHESRFEELITMYDFNNNKEYDVAFYILSLPVFDMEKIKSYIKSDGRILFDDMINEGYWSSGEIGLMKLAHTLFSGVYDYSIMDIFSSLDHINKLAAMEAMRIRFIFV